MARKTPLRPKPAQPDPLAPQGVTADRAARLHRLLRLLARGSQTRERLTKQLKLDVRGFYRDLRLLRAVGIDLALRKGRYTLTDNAESAVARLPFPDPLLTLGEAVQLAKGRTLAHRKLQGQIAQILR